MVRGCRGKFKWPGAPTTTSDLRPCRKKWPPNAAFWNYAALPGDASSTRLTGFHWAMISTRYTDLGAEGSSKKVSEAPMAESHQGWRKRYLDRFYKSRQGWVSG